MTKIEIAGRGRVIWEVDAPSPRRLGREGIARGCGMQVAASVDELLGLEPDGVIAATPMDMNAAQASAVFRASRAEKPSAHSWKAAGALAALEHKRALRAFHYRHLLLREMAYRPCRTTRRTGDGVAYGLAVLYFALRFFKGKVIVVRKQGQGAGRDEFSRQTKEPGVFRIEAPVLVEIDSHTSLRFPIWPLDERPRCQSEHRAARWGHASSAKAFRFWVLRTRGEGGNLAPFQDDLRAQRVLEWR